MTKRVGDLQAAIGGGAEAMAAINGAVTELSRLIRDPLRSTGARMTLAMASAVEERTASTREVASPVVAVPQAARETGGSPRRCGRFR